MVARRRGPVRFFRFRISFYRGCTSFYTVLQVFRQGVGGVLLFGFTLSVWLLVLDITCGGGV